MDKRWIRMFWGMMLTFTFVQPFLFAKVSPDEKAVVAGNNQFAMDLYGQLKTEDGNLFFSPNSISTALAMTYAGARGDTATQMAKTLHFTLDQGKLHPAFFALSKTLQADPMEQPYELSIANALWGQSGYKFLAPFVNITKEYYGAGFKELDFKTDPESCRLTINQWVEDKTHKKITDLIPAGVIKVLTRLVLTNAIYFKGRWAEPFKKESTSDEDFFISSSAPVKVPTMRNQKYFSYAEDANLQLLEMPYKGGSLSMVILLPKQASGLSELESALTQENLDPWLKGLNHQKVLVYLPKFETTKEFGLGKALSSLGMNDAFSEELSDFTGMTDEKPKLYIGAVIHKAYVAVDEEGTEAAAATAVTFTARAFRQEEPPVIFRADHPFVFLIRDKYTGAILFMGRVVDPRK